MPWARKKPQRLRKCLQREVGFPSYSSFVRARHGPDFKNLKRREKHFHCRCPTCAELTTRLHMAARNQESRVDFDKMLKAHYFEVKHWRGLETSYQSQAKMNPESVTVLSYDATQSFGFPHWTKRPIKSMPNDALFRTFSQAFL